MHGNNMNFSNLKGFAAILRQMPNATAIIRGSSAFPDIKGCVKFYQVRCGVIVAAEIFGLPDSNEICKSPVYAFHIHRGGRCTGSSEDPFADAMTHYNPDNCPHPYHAGDMPPLFSNNGYAFQAFLTDRFTVDEVVGKTVIIHSGVDDFTTQPSGNAGTKIACGVIER
ncbi:MAG: superoxide dismutase family protein [Eubacterium sp.]